MAKIKAMANSFANILPEVVTSIALFVFSISCGTSSFIGTIISAAVMSIAAVSIDFSKYEKGGEQ